MTRVPSYTTPCVAAMTRPTTTSAPSTERRAGETPGGSVWNRSQFSRSIITPSERPMID